MNEPRESPTPSDPGEPGFAVEPILGTSEGAANESAPPVSREEQLARFEDALKEEDWGHQPC